MIYDLNKNYEQNEDQIFDICIIGAGAAGISLAKKFSEANLNTALCAQAGLGISTSALSAGGSPNQSTGVATTEEFTGTGAAIGAWPTGGSMNTSRLE